MSKKRETEEVLDAVRRHGGSFSAAGRELGLHRTVVERRWKNHAGGEVRGPQARKIAEPPPAPPEHDEAKATEVQRLRDENRRLERLLRERRRESVDAAYLREVAFKLAAERPDVPRWTRTPSGASGSAGIPTLLLSDLHWGEVVRPSEVWGLNEYDLAVAQRRLRRVVESAMHLLRDHIVSRAGYPGIVVQLGGDMVSGSIHEELLATDEAPPAACVVDLVGHLAAAIRMLADDFGRVMVPCVTGNHGRATTKTWKKRRAHTSWDWMVYQMLEREFVHDERVSFHVSDDTDVRYTLFGGPGTRPTRYLLTHGDELGVKGGDGIIGALGPIRRGVVKITRAEAAVGREHDVMCMGHWHQYIALPDTIVNNTLKGYDEYARAQRFTHSTPSQALWLTHPRHGVTIAAPVFAEDARVDAPDRGKAQWFELQ